MIENEFILRVPIFASLKPLDLEHLKTLWKPITRNPGQLLFKKGDPGDAMYIVESGQIGITVWTEDNQEKILSTFGEGDFFGELALLDGSPRSAHAKALKKAHLYEMRREDFFHFIQHRPEIAIMMMMIIATRLRAANEMVERSTTKNPNEEIKLHARLGDKIAVRIAKITGSWEFIFIFLSLLTGWIVLNLVGFFGKPLDPYPFNFLNFVVAFLTAVQAPIILMSQNRQYENDRLRSELEFETNVKAELQIQSLHTKIDELRSSELHDLSRFQNEIHQEIAELKKKIEGKNLEG
jgi:uncharacterized membrane protein